MEMARYLVEAHLREGRSVAELASSHGVHRSWIYKLLTLRHRSRLHHVGVGRAHKGQRVLVLVADRDVRVLSVDGEILRALTLDPSRDYQPLD